ncbi:hypothetical protein V1478_009501 [Vespula squamosa]|uniref:Uncharacterized protein n=1 Tax=Vespula squamosa TaxID=30214 RepID=A0ABD2APU8_VESSQ
MQPSKKDLGSNKVFDKVLLSVTILKFTTSNNGASFLPNTGLNCISKVHKHPKGLERSRTLNNIDQLKIPMYSGHTECRKPFFYRTTVNFVQPLVDGFFVLVTDLSVNVISLLRDCVISFTIQGNNIVQQLSLFVLIKKNNIEDNKGFLVNILRRSSNVAHFRRVTIVIF